MHILFSIVSPRRQLVLDPVATPTPLNRASISCNLFLIGCYLAFADSAFTQSCYRIDNNSILTSTGTRTDLCHASKRSSCMQRNKILQKIKILVKYYIKYIYIYIYIYKVNRKETMPLWSFLSVIFDFQVSACRNFFSSTESIRICIYLRSKWF